MTENADLTWWKSEGNRFIGPAWPVPAVGRGRKQIGGIRDVKGKSKRKVTVTHAWRRAGRARLARSANLGVKRSEA